MKMTLDFVQGICFGFQTKPNWISMLKTLSIADIIENMISKKQFENSLNSAINSAYNFLSIFEFKDLDSDIIYLMKFDNNKKKWILEIKDSKDAEVSLEEKNEFFKNDSVKELITDISFKLFNQIKTTYFKYVMPMIEAGNFLTVDEAKAEAIKDFLEDRELQSQFEKIVFEK